jgi:Asp-tRNA(Asn)/Glu-tRNA(Gln) amidotransferase A subunit family amidase
LVEPGLPVGINVVGPYLEDKMALAFAREASLVANFQPPPGFA